MIPKDNPADEMEDELRAYFARALLTARDQFRTELAEMTAEREQLRKDKSEYNDWEYRSDCEATELAGQVEELRAELAAAQQELAKQLDPEPCPHCWGMPSAENDPCTCTVGAQLAAEKQRADRLAEVVEKLPETADGVPITPGMRLWW